MTGKEIYEVGDKVKIISKKIIGTIKVVNIEKFTNYESLKEDYRWYYLINDGENNYLVDSDDVELYSSENQLIKYKRAFEIIKKHSKVDYIENTNINDLSKDYNLFICEINSVEDKDEYELLEELMMDE